MKYVLLTFLFSLIIITIPKTGRSQACCSAGTPLLSSLELPGTEKDVWQFVLSYDYNTLKDVVRKNREIVFNNDRKRTTHSILLETSYGLTSRISISALLSLIQQNRWGTAYGSGSNESVLQSKGIGDMILLFKYTLIPLNMATQQSLSIGFGPKLPAGISGAKIDGITIPEDMQPGSGSWDSVIWGYYYKGFLPVTRFNLFATASLKLTGDNIRDYKFGNDLTLTAGTSYQTDTLFDYTFMLRYRNASPDERFGNNLPNTGGQWLYLVPGINVKKDKTTSFRITGQIPVYRDLKGQQLTTSYTVTGSFLYTFNPYGSIISFK